MTNSPRDLSRAEAMGRLAARSGQPLGSCPFEANGDPDQRQLAARFVHAYVGAGGTVAVDYEDGAGPGRGTPATRHADTPGGPVTVHIRRRLD